MSEAKELFTAYQTGDFPKEHGYIVSTFYHDTSTYTRYELISFDNVKDIYTGDGGLTFQAEGRKIYVLVEPAGWPDHHTEPAYRPEGDRIPYRRKELIDYMTRRQDHVLIGREPVVTYSAFTVLKPTGQDAAYIFYPTDEVRQNILEYFRISLWKQARVPQSDVRELLKSIDEAFDKIVLGGGQFQ